MYLWEILSKINLTENLLIVFLNFRVLKKVQFMTHFINYNNAILDQRLKAFCLTTIPKTFYLSLSLSKKKKKNTSCFDNPFLPCLFGVFMKRGKMVLSPRMSTNLLQQSAPSGPVRAWSRTLRAPLRESFFSLTKWEIKSK